MNRRMVSNAFWIMSEKLIAVFGLIFVTSFVAKYVGPEIFGEIAFATSIFQITQIVAQMGGSVIILKRMSRNIDSGVKLVVTTTWLRLLIFLILSIPFIAFTYSRLGDEGLYFILACCLSCLFVTLDVYNVFFDAKLESKTNTLINVFGLAISLTIRWLIAWLELEPVWLCLPIVLTGLIPFILRRMVFNRLTHQPKVKFTHQLRYARFLFFSGLTFVLSAISVALYTRVSILGLESFSGHDSVGVFAVAASLAGSWSFVFNAFITSTLPSIFAETDDDKALEKTARLIMVVVLLSLPIFMVVYLFSPYFIAWFYGEKYTAAFIPLVIISVATLLSALGTISARLIAKYSGYAFLSKKTLLVLLFSVALNVPLIHYYGLNGAAWATMLTELFSLTLFNYFFRQGIIFKLHANVFKLGFSFFSKKALNVIAK